MTSGTNPGANTGPTRQAKARDAGVNGAMGAGADFASLFRDSFTAQARLAAGLRAVPTAGLSGWARQYLEDIGAGLETGINDPWFILPALHGVAQLKSGDELNADPLRWFGRRAGLSMKTVNAYHRCAKWLYQPSCWPLDPKTSADFSPAKCASLQTREQSRLREAFAQYKISLQGIEQLTHSVKFLRDEARHLGPGLIHDALKAFGVRPDLHALHAHVAKRVRDINLALNENPIPESFNQIRFGATDLNGMMSINMRCNAQLGENIKQHIAHYIGAHPERINHKVNRHARNFQALYQLVTSRANITGTGSETPVPDLNASIGVVMTMREYEQAYRDPSRRVTTQLGTRPTWQELQENRPNPIDWIMLIGQEGTVVKQTHEGRFATSEQRILMTAAAPFCAYPDCTQRSTDSQAHHVKPYSQGGKTSLDNLAFLCQYHHPQNDDTRIQPGKFHVELDRNRIPYILRHRPDAKPEYNKHNLEHSAVLKTLSMQPPPRNQADAGGAEDLEFPSLFESPPIIGEVGDGDPPPPVIG